jgi:predicted nucleic acid-binding protein
VAALAVISDLERAGIKESHEFGPALWQAAGVLKATHRRVSLADCFAIALANSLGATLLTADHHEFDALATQKVCQVEFIR